MQVNSLDFLRIVLAAAEVATHVVKQECFDNELLNLLSVYSILKWIELPFDQRVFNRQTKAEEEVDESEHFMEEEEVKLVSTIPKLLFLD